MSVYCTVEEAWGGRFNANQSFQPTLLQNQSDDYDNNYNRGNDKVKKPITEGFADIESEDAGNRLYSQNANTVYKPGQEYIHSSNKYRQFRLQPNRVTPALTSANKDKDFDYDKANVALMPKSYDNLETTTNYYDFATDGAFKNQHNNGSRASNYTNVVGETQLNKYNPSQEHDSDLCDNVTLHIMHCKTCQDSVLKIMKKIDSEGENASSKKKKKEKYTSSASYHDNDNDESSDNDGDDEKEKPLDFTEIILFIACGIFFIFLLDSIVAIGKRFK